MLLSTCFTLSYTLRGRMAMKAVQSKTTIAIMQPPLWVGISPVELACNEIVHNHFGTPTEKNKLQQWKRNLYYYIMIVCPVLTLFFEM